MYCSPDVDLADQTDFDLNPSFADL